MRFIPVFLLISIVLLASCDGRDRAYKSNQEIFEQSELSDEFKEIVSYYPETYTEVVTDSTFSNGFSLQIKFYSNMDESMLRTTVVDSLTYKHYIREFESEIKVHYQSRLVFQGVINKEFMVNHGVATKGELDSLYLNNTDVWKTEVLEDDRLTVDILYDEFKGLDATVEHYQLHITKDGNYYLTKPEYINERLTYARP